MEEPTLRPVTDLAMARRGLLALAAGLGMAAPGHAETYPSRPIRLIVPFTPGGGTDNLGRLVARALTDRLGQPVVIENRGGAGGNIGQAVAATAPADGYTTLFTGNGIVISDLLFRNPGFDWKKDFVHVA